MTNSIGVGLGIYTAHGNKTCQGFPGSLSHETQDATLYLLWMINTRHETIHQSTPGSTYVYDRLDVRSRYKEWGVTFVKNDWCWHSEENKTKHLDAFNAMR